MTTYLSIDIKPHNDMYMDETGNLAMVYGAEAIGQHIRQRLKFWKDEWFLDRSAGVEWLRYLLGQQPSIAPVAEAVIKREILQTPGVTGILSIDVSYERVSRGFFVRSCTVQTVFDEPITIEA